MTETQTKQRLFCLSASGTSCSGDRAAAKLNRKATVSCAGRSPAPHTEHKQIDRRAAALLVLKRKEQQRETREGEWGEMEAKEKGKGEREEEGRARCRTASGNGRRARRWF